MRTKKLWTFVVLGAKHARSAAAEELYLQGVADWTRPVAIYGLVTAACNARCLSCTYWREPPRDEMTAPEWCDALLSLKEFVGSYSINFSGGEPFLKPGFMDILQCCHDAGISAGVTTNGAALTPETVKRLVAARPFNVNISVDAPVAELHDHLRGYPGLFDRLCAGIGRLREEQRREGVEFPILIKPTISRANLRSIPHMTAWARGVGATAVQFQPVEKFSPEVETHLWITPEHLDELEHVINSLVAQRAAGGPILNSESSLRQMAEHFRSGQQGLRDAATCRVGLRNYFIRPSGDVEICWGFPPIGNVRRQSAREIWYSQRARQLRAACVRCRKICGATCVVRRSLGDMARVAARLFAGR